MMRGLDILHMLSPMAQTPDKMSANYGFGLFPVPVCRPARQGEWRIENHLPSRCDGYLDTCAIEARSVLRQGKTVWMSIGLLEKESHAWHVHCAHGVVVTAGLGMGMYAYAAAMKADVDLVIVSEISPHIVALMQASTDFENWPCRDKVKIIQADALGADFARQVEACAAGRGVDYLYADIWPNFPAAEAPAQSAAMVAALRPRAAGWWGQELSLAQYCRAAGRAIDEEAIGTFFSGLGIPAPPITPGYVDFCRDVARTYGMGERKTLWQRLGTLFRRA